MRGLPLTDLMYLLLVYGMEVKQQSYSRTVQSLLEPDTLSAVEQDVLSDYLTAFHLDAAYQDYAVQFMVLQNIVTLAARRPQGFKRLEEDLRSLPDWLWRSPTAGVPSLLSE